MKKRKLFLSLICSIILTVSLVTFTIVSVVSNNSVDEPTVDIGGNAGTVSDPNESTDGTAENPYIIYSAESFVELLSEYGTKAASFELSNDIDFADYGNFVTLFNDGSSFNGKINGNGYSLSNITIAVTLDNIDDYLKIDTANAEAEATVAIFGSVKGAEITALNIKDITVSVDDEVYAYLSDAGLASKQLVFTSLKIGTLAGKLYSSTVDVAVNGTISADAYVLYEDGQVVDFNSLGGLASVVYNSSITGSVDVAISTDVGDNYYVGGIAGYVYSSTIKDMTISVDYSGIYSQELYIGGVAGYIRGGEIENVSITLNASEAGERADVAEFADFLSSTVYTDAEKMGYLPVTWVAGIASVAQADSNSQALTISNVTVNADVDMDVLYAGAFITIKSADAETDTIYVTVSDITLNSNVNTLAAYGLARNAVNLQVGADAVENNGINIKLTGNIILGERYVSSAFITNIGDVVVIDGTKSVNVEISSSIFTTLEKIEQIRNYSISIVA